jgi:hypothetical protein
MEIFGGLSKAKACWLKMKFAINRTNTNDLKLFFMFPSLINAASGG